MLGWRLLLLRHPVLGLRLLRRVERDGGWADSVRVVANHGITGGLRLAKGCRLHSDNGKGRRGEEDGFLTRGHEIVEETSVRDGKGQVYGGGNGTHDQA